MNDPYRSPVAAVDDREDEAFAALSSRVVRARSVIAAVGTLSGLAIGVGLYLVIDSIVVAHLPYYTMLATMLAALGTSFWGTRAIARRFVSRRMRGWIDELSARFGVTHARLVDLASIFSPAEEELPVHIARQRRNPSE
jgi:hypothetical protein